MWTAIVKMSKASKDQFECTMHSIEDFMAMEGHSELQSCLLEETLLWSLAEGKSDTRTVRKSGDLQQLPP